MMRLSLGVHLVAGKKGEAHPKNCTFKLEVSGAISLSSSIAISILFMFTP